MLPIAREIQRRGQEGVWWAETTRRSGGICVFFAPAPDDPQGGRCTIYRYRPSLCRLFGFSAVRDKWGGLRLAACSMMKADHGERIAEAQARKEPTPVFTLWASRVLQVLETASHQEMLPINVALRKALEIVALYPPEKPVSPAGAPRSSSRRRLRA